VDGYIDVSDRPGLGIDLTSRKSYAIPTSRRTPCRCSLRMGKARRPLVPRKGPVHAPHTGLEDKEITPR
jgi:hypothetical protein